MSPTRGVSDFAALGDELSVSWEELNQFTRSTREVRHPLALFRIVQSIHTTQNVWELKARKRENVLFTETLNTFYLRYMVYVHHTIDEEMYTTAFVVKHWLQRTIDQWVHYDGSNQLSITPWAKTFTRSFITFMRTLRASCYSTRLSEAQTPVIYWTVCLGQKVNS